MNAWGAATVESITYLLTQARTEGLAAGIAESSEGAYGRTGHGTLRGTRSALSTSINEKSTLPTSLIACRESFSRRTCCSPSGARTGEDHGADWAANIGHLQVGWQNSQKRDF